MGVSPVAKGDQGRVRKDRGCCPVGVGELLDARSWVAILYTPCYWCLVRKLRGKVGGGRARWSICARATCLARSTVESAPMVINTYLPEE